MKPFITIRNISATGNPEYVVEEHASVDAAKREAEDVLYRNDVKEVFIFSLVHRAYSEVVTRFDSGLDNVISSKV